MGGFYGEQSEFVCGSNGAFTGRLPVCYELKVVARFASFASIGIVIIFLGFQYKFWCMYKKIQLNHDVNIIPPALKGRWLEQVGMTVWDVMLEERRTEANRSAYDFEEKDAEK